MPESATKTAAESKKREKNFRPQIERLGRPVVVSEGDSWFSFPFRWNLIDFIDRMDEVALFRMERSGDTLRQILGASNRKRLGRVLRQYEVDLLLFSGGGNDIVGEEDLLPLLADRKTVSTWEEVLVEPAVDERFAALELRYRELAALRDTHRKSCKIVVHGYDWAIPGRKPVKIAGIPLVGPWMLPALKQRNVKDPAEQRAIIRALLSRFNDLLESLAGDLREFHYVPLLDTLAEDEWGDEIHPKSSGFRKLAERYRPTLQRLFPGRFTRAVDL